MAQANRKRGRDMEEDSGELPLSKRINNLHLNNLNGGRPENLTENMESYWGNQKFAPSPNHSEPSQGSSSCDGYSSSQSSHSIEYRPELSASENPYYYENNKLLYNLHMERIQREDRF